MGILAELLELMKKQNENGERATPEKVLALAVVKESRKEKESREDGE